MNPQLEPLLLEAKRGNKHAYSQAVELMQQSIFSYCYLMVGNYHDAEDMAQEVFVRAYYQLPKYEEMGSASGWLYTIAHRLCLNSLKKKSRWKQLLMKVSNEAMITPVEVKEEFDQGMVLLQSLSIKQRELMILKIVHDLNYEEISQITGVSAVNLRKQMERARKKLQSEHTEKMKRGILYEQGQ